MVIIHFYKSIIIHHYYPLLSIIIIHYYPLLLSIIIHHYYPLLSIIIVHYYPLLSMAINQDVIIIHGHCECLKQSTRWGGIYLCLTN